MTITQTTHPAAGYVLSNVFIPLWHKSTGECKRNHEEESNHDNSIKRTDFKKQNFKHTS